MRINLDPKLDFDDVLLVPQRTKTASRKNVTIDRKFSFYHSERSWEGIPIIAANMDSTGTFSMAESLSPHKMVTCLHKHYPLKKQVEKFVSMSEEKDTSWDGDYVGEHWGYVLDYMWYGLGIKDEDLDGLRKFVDGADIIPNICVDVANGYTDDFVNFCQVIRDEFAPHQAPIIMAGNVCTPEMVQELILHGGVDIVKVGIGPGSACTTRLKTGVGYPQLSAIEECAHAAHGLKSDEKRLGLICADGGCRTPSDVCKAFAANADFVMLGGMLAGVDECEGEWEYETDIEWGIRDQKTFTAGKINGRKKRFFQFYGMSSHHAQEKHGSTVKNYRASEGRIKKIPYKGPVEDVVREILGGIRSACSYMGATCLKDMAKCAEFIQVNRTHFDQSV